MTGSQKAFANEPMMSNGLCTRLINMLTMETSLSAVGTRV
jgi:hypothetical protein